MLNIDERGVPLKSNWRWACPAHPTIRGSGKKAKECDWNMHGTQIQKMERNAMRMAPENTNGTGMACTLQNLGVVTPFVCVGMIAIIKCIDFSQSMLLVYISLLQKPFSPARMKAESSSRVCDSNLTEHKQHQFHEPCCKPNQHAAPGHGCHP